MSRGPAAARARAPPRPPGRHQGRLRAATPSPAPPTTAGGGLTVCPRPSAAVEAQSVAVRRPRPPGRRPPATGSPPSEPAHHRRRSRRSVVGLDEHGELPVDRRRRQSVPADGADTPDMKRAASRSRRRAERRRPSRTARPASSPSWFVLPRRTVTEDAVAVGRVGDKSAPAQRASTTRAWRRRVRPGPSAAVPERRNAPTVLATCHQPRRRGRGRPRPPRRRDYGGLLFIGDAAERGELGQRYCGEGGVLEPAAVEPSVEAAERAGADAPPPQSPSPVVRPTPRRGCRCPVRPAGGRPQRTSCRSRPRLQGCAVGTDGLERSRTTMSTAALACSRCPKSRTVNARGPQGVALQVQRPSCRFAQDSCELIRTRPARHR